MKVVLDLTRLLRDGQITQEEYDRLRRLAGQDTGSLAFNLLVGVGVVAVAGAALAMVPTPATAIVLGGLIIAAGLALLGRRPTWLLLANICILVAALLFGGGILILADGSLGSFLLVAAIFLAAAMAARSALLTALGILAVVGALGAGTAYAHAFYVLVVPRPLLTVLVCSALAIGASLLARLVQPDWERLCLVAARTGLFCANFGFWVGSLWGDDVDNAARAAPHAQGGLPPAFFSIAWAVALVAVGIWAARANRRWALNLVAVFGAIHFYTQWFETLSATPLSVLIAGLLTLTAAFGLWRLNNRLGPHVAGLAAGGSRSA